MKKISWCSFVFCVHTVYIRTRGLSSRFMIGAHQGQSNFSRLFIIFFVRCLFIKEFLFIRIFDADNYGSFTYCFGLYPLSKREF